MEAVPSRKGCKKTSGDIASAYLGKSRFPTNDNDLPPAPCPIAMRQAAAFIKENLQKKVELPELIEAAASLTELGKEWVRYELRRVFPHLWSR